MWSVNGVACVVLITLGLDGRSVTLIRGGVQFPLHTTEQVMDENKESRLKKLESEYIEPWDESKRRKQITAEQIREVLEIGCRKP